MSGTSSINSFDMPADQLVRELQIDLENKNLFSGLDIYNMGSASQKVTLIKLCNSERETLLHLLANKILDNQEEEQDTSFLRKSAFEILTTGKIQKDLKDIVNVEDANDFSFLDFAIFIKNEKLNFVYQILKLIPKEDRAICKRDIGSEDFQAELETQDVETLFGFFKLSNDKTSLTKKCGPKNVTLLHILGMQIIKNQAKKQDISYLMDITLKILKTKALKKDLKNLVTALDEDGQCFLDYAVLCRSEKLNFMDDVLKLIPIEDRDECLRFIFQRVLKNEDLDAALALFYLSKDSEKTSLAKIQIPKKTTLIQMLVMRIYQDLGKKRTNELLEKLIEVLKKIDPKEIKEIANLQNSTGRTTLHLAALCKDKTLNLLSDLLKFMPSQDRAACLKTQDSLQGWTPLHYLANVTTHEDDLNQRRIQEILDLLPSEKDKKNLEEIRDTHGRSYREIQEKKKQAEVSHEKEGDRKKYLEEKRKTGLAAVIAAQRNATSSPFNLKSPDAVKCSQSGLNIPPTRRGLIVADFGIPPQEPRRPKTPPPAPTPNLLESLERPIYDDLK
ncbi:MAG: hypothetical protein KR126chlam5_00208 [Candidatus Anoxychlamydiales bacterium]|nr:hypothetical protein [Candidatus Anoxychlamydiales bacterium]